MLTAIIPHPNGDDFRAEIHGDHPIELSQNVRAFIMLEGYGASDVGGLFSVYREGNIVATVSFNGKFNWRDTAYRHDFFYATCVTDDELADELENLTQDEAAELAETIEAERAKAIADLKSC